MKKLLRLVLLSLIVVAALAVTLKLVYQPKKISSLAEIVPNRVVYYLEADNLSSSLEEFSQSPFCQKLSGLSVYKKYLKPQIDENLAYISYLTELFENDTGLALFVSDLSSLDYKPNSTDPSQAFSEIGKFYQELYKVLILTRIGSDDKKLTKILGELYLSSSDEEGAMSEEKYQGIKITSYQIPEPGLTLSWALLSDVAVISNDLETLKSSIDLYKEESQASLANDQYFKQISQNRQSQKKDSLAWIFVHYRNYFDKMMDFSPKSLASPEIAAMSKKMNKYFKNYTDVLEAAISFIDYDEFKQGIEIKSYQTFDETKAKKSFLNILYPPRNLDKALFKILPRKTIAFYAISLDLTKAWEHFKTFLNLIDETSASSLANSPYSFKPTAAIDSFESFIGANIEEDVLPLLGGSLGFFFSGLKAPALEANPAPGNMMALIPEPELSFCAQIKDSQKAKEVFGTAIKRLIIQANDLAKVGILAMQAQKADQESEVESLQPDASGAVVENQPIPQSFEEIEDVLKLKVQDYQGVEINALSITDVPFEPNYFVLDKYFIISASLAQTKKMINAQKGKLASLASFLDSQKIKTKLFSSNSVISLFDFSGLLGELEKLGLFSFVRQSIPMMTQGALSANDFNAVLDILDDIGLALQATYLSQEGLIEGLLYFEIEGL